jgi:selenocysteine lyase/cysteine desulfurase
MTLDKLDPLWDEYRQCFPVTERYVYLNHAAVAPLVRPAAEAMQWLAGDALMHGSVHYDVWVAEYDRLRASAGRLMDADPAEIAIVKNTSEGIATVVLGIDWRAGDRIAVFEEEFPANFLPWKKLEERGVRITWLSLNDALDRIDEAARGARLLTVSFVNYLSGHRVDLEAIGEICQRHGCFFFVDAIQGLGAFPLSARRARIDALSADGHKWLLGPEGCGILYVRRDIQDAVKPAELGWTNFARFADYAARDLTLRPDAGRYECGTLNTIGIFGLRAAIDFLLGIGMERIAPVVQASGDEIAAQVTARGYEVLGQRTPQNGSGIVSFRRAGADARHIVRLLKQREIIAAPRQGWVRVSPHFYVGPEGVERFVAGLDAR